MNPIDGPRWRALSPLLDELLDTPLVARQARLRQIAAQDRALAEELESLLAEHATVERAGFLEAGPSLPLPVGLAGQVIDRYTLDHQIGEGGMGSVWLAHRSDGRFEGQAAIKFLSLPAMGPSGRMRFEREGHVLARLKHPNIAHLLDAGLTESGQPYLVLEYVEGQPLDAWCRDRGLDTDARIKLFLQVLAAVSHAHGKLILHRDLKPSNILVTNEGQVKLLDFGIAKLLDEGSGAAGEMTQLAGRVFTPDYAAPEQIRGEEVTTATDVYALGVMLYYLLTGKHPTAGGVTTPAERMRAVLDTEPKRPSAAVADSAGDSEVTADASLRARILRGDLDNILGKALKKAPEERYPTADSLAQDLQRYLNNQPVSARPDSVAYRLRKFVVRNALPVAAASLVVTAIVVAAVVSFRQAQEATRQRDRALALSVRNAAVLDFVTGMLTEVAADDQPVRVSELLDRSQEILMASYGNQDHQAAILDLLAEYYLSAGNPTKAQPLLDRALELSANSTDPALKASVICNNGHALALMNQRDQALAAMEQGIALSQVDPLAATRCLQKRAYVAHNFNDARSALDYVLQAQAQLQRAAVRKPDMEASLLGDIAYGHYLSGNTAEADRYYAEALARYAAIGRAESPATFSLRNNWGIASFAAGDNRRALENYDEALSIASKRALHGELPTYLLSNRALALASLARYDEAIEAFDAAFAAATRNNNMASVTHSLVNRAGTYLLRGDIERAERELAVVDRDYGAMIPADSVPAVSILHIKGRLAAARGELPTALAHQSAVIDFFDQRGMAVAPVARALNARADLHVKLGDIESARADVERALSICRKLQGSKRYSSLTGLALLQLADVEKAAGVEAAAVAKAGEAAQHLVETLGDSHPDTVRAKAF
ncbi:MAG TPA: serine/threonine-protein kinase [Steroidobacter sp.]|uniref:serine/threonine protein kinase n=1 Tax=Steroidobacter sp. TaxID=1978227 RepID=UPI002ED7CFF1